MIRQEIIDLLKRKEEEYNNRSFIENDPISIPHQFSKKEDIEIAGFLSATIAWGQRKSIIKNANRLLDLMDHSPADFIMSHSAKDLKSLSSFVHRTFNGTDCIQFMSALKKIYAKHGGLEKVFLGGIKKDDTNIKNSIIYFRSVFVKGMQERTLKHVSDPGRNSAAKRLCMYLRWMVRRDQNGCDFGIWKSISPSLLCLPLDVHSGNVARSLGLLQRKQNDWKAVEEVSDVLRKIDPKDPAKFDYALFGMGVNGELQNVKGKQLIRKKS